MSGFTSTYLADKLLDLVLGAQSYTPPSTIEFALFSTMPAADGTGGTELAGSGYSRVSWLNNSSYFAAASGRVKKSKVALTWPTASGDWTGIVGAGMYDGSNLLFAGPFDSPATVKSGKTLTIAAGNVRVGFDGVNTSDYLANALLDHVLGATTYTPVGTVYLTLLDAALSQPGGASPVSIANNLTNFPAAPGGVKSLHIAETMSSCYPWAKTCVKGAFTDGTNQLWYATLDTLNAVFDSIHFAADTASVQIQ